MAIEAVEQRRRRARVPRQRRPYAPQASDERILSAAEAWDVFDADARNELGISGEEFLHRWDVGEYRFEEESELAMKVNRMAMMMPFVRSSRG